MTVDQLLSRLNDARISSIEQGSGGTLIYFRDIVGDGSAGGDVFGVFVPNVQVVKPKTRQYPYKVTDVVLYADTRSIILSTTDDQLEIPIPKGVTSISVFKDKDGSIVLIPQGNSESKSNRTLRVPAPSGIRASAPSGPRTVAQSGEGTVGSPTRIVPLKDLRLPRSSNGFLLIDGQDYRNFGIRGPVVTISLPKRNRYSTLSVASIDIPGVGPNGKGYILVPH